MNLFALELLRVGIYKYTSDSNFILYIDPHLVYSDEDILISPSIVLNVFV